MTITYDSEVDALYIRFIEATVTTENLAEGIALDYAADGRMAGIEILDALRSTLRGFRAQRRAAPISWSLYCNW
jgi:uncharacterized protein YuzE